MCIIVWWIRISWKLSDGNFTRTCNRNELFIADKSFVRRSERAQQAAREMNGELQNDSSGGAQNQKERYTTVRLKQPGTFVSSRLRGYGKVKAKNVFRSEWKRRMTELRCMVCLFERTASMRERMRTQIDRQVDRYTQTNKPVAQ